MRELFGYAPEALIGKPLDTSIPQADVRELLQQQGQVESMTRLLNALLYISRLESGAIEPVSAAGNRIVSQARRA